MVKGAPEKTKQTVKASAWQNRIVGTGEESPEQLLANPKNWRIHPQAQQEGLTAILDEVGWVQNVIVNKRTGYLIDGHLRVTLAMRRNEPRIPVAYVDLSQKEEDLILATLDPLAGLAAVDRGQLKSLLDGVEAEDEALRVLLASIGEQEGLVVAAPPSLTELGEKHGEHDPETFWPVLKMRLPTEIFERFEIVLDSMPGKTESDKVAAMLDRVEIP